jgi:DNA-binding response OmpR family regulator
MMPRRDGISALRELRSTEAGRDCAVVMVSALAEADTIAEATEAGCDDYVVKPVAPDDLSDRVLRLVRGTQDRGLTA